MKKTKHARWLSLVLSIVMLLAISSSSLTLVASAANTSTSKTINVTANAQPGQKAVSIDSGKKAVKAKSDSSWLSASQNKAKTGLVIDWKANPNKAKRVGKITVTTGLIIKKTIATVKVTQSGNTLTVLPTSISFDVAGGTQYITAKAGCGISGAPGYDVKNVPTSWLSYIKADGKLSFTAKANVSEKARSCTVTVTSGDLTPITVTIRQNPIVCTLSPARKAVSAASGSVTVNAILNYGHAEAAPKANWISVGQTSNSFRINYACNPKGSSRSGTVEITIPDTGIKKTFTLTQAANYLQVTPNPVSFGAGSETKSVTVNTGCGIYSVTGNPEWITYTKDGTTLNLTASANMSTTTRSGEIKIVSGDLRETLKFSQSGKSPSSGSNPFAYTPSAGEKPFANSNRPTPKDLVYTNADAVSSYWFAYNSSQARALNRIFSGLDVPLYRSSTGALVDTRLGQQAVPPNKTNKDGTRETTWTCYVGNHVWSGESCLIYACAVFYPLNGYVPNEASTTTADYFSGSKGQICSCTNSASWYCNKLKSKGVKLGSYIRTESKNDGGHSFIVLYYDENGIWFLDANGDCKGTVAVRGYEWSRFHSFITYHGRGLFFCKNPK